MPIACNYEMRNSPDTGAASAITPAATRLNSFHGAQPIAGIPYAVTSRLACAGIWQIMTECYICGYSSPDPEEFIGFGIGAEDIRIMCADGYSCLKRSGYARDDYVV
jgi:hypothetical protein